MKQLLITQVFVLLQLSAMAQSDACFIYGTLTTKNGSNYTGSIRWNNEEALWTDYFQAIKTVNKYHAFVGEGDILESLYSWLNMKHDAEEERAYASTQKKVAVNSENDGEPKVISEAEMKMMLKEKADELGLKEEEIEKLEHVWVAHFGDIKSIKITGPETVTVSLKDGEQVKLKNGSNDFNTDIKLLDEELGEIVFQWDKIDQITFSPSPKILPIKFGKPLYATLKTTEGLYAGFVQWGYDKSLDTDKLICNNTDGELAIEFKNIQRIEASEHGHIVTLNSGRTLAVKKLENDDPHEMGINVWVDGFGKIYFPLEIIVSAEFENAGKNHLPSFYDFAPPKALTGVVYTNDNKSYSGIIAYDLDEEYDFELIQGMNKGLYYSITLRNIKEIKPINDKTSSVGLRVGKTVLVGNSHDVAASNSGMLIFETGKNEPVYVKWGNVNRVVFH